ncbi:MAG TPA: TonB-dependent receptor plug domain-containing protein, partial [Steroidobacter sp.]
MKTKYPLYLSCLLPLTTTPALAQDQTDTESVTITEIVVTARRAEESLQKVPLSITALGANDLQAAGISSVEEIAALTPGFSFRNGFGRGFERPVIRGMANIGGAANASFFIDGIYVNGPISGYNIDNLERVEVIRGPQSALFGRSTFAGAINYVTRKPTDEFEGRVEATTGNYNRQNVSLWASGPIVEGKLRFQINGSYYNRDGQYLNLASGEKDVGGERTKSFGGALSWTPVEWF